MPTINGRLDGQIGSLVRLECADHEKPVLPVYISIRCEVVRSHRRVDHRGLPVPASSYAIGDMVTVGQETIDALGCLPIPFLKTAANGPKPCGTEIPPRANGIVLRLIPYVSRGGMAVAEMRHTLGHLDGLGHGRTVGKNQITLANGKRLDHPGDDRQIPPSKGTAGTGQSLHGGYMNSTGVDRIREWRTIVHKRVQIRGPVPGSESVKNTFSTTDCDEPIMD